MADELQISTQFAFAKENAALTAIVQTVMDVTEYKYTDLVQFVTGDTVALEYGSVDPTKLGMIVIQNIGEFDISMRTAAGGDYLWSLKAGTATEPGGIFVGYANSVEHSDIGIEFEVYGALGTGRLSIRMIER